VTAGERHPHRASGARRLIDPAAVESVIGRALVIGTYVAMLFILVGVLGMLVDGINPMSHATPVPFDLSAIPGEILALEPVGFLWLGIVTVIALPVGRVVFAGISLLAAGERRLALVALGVLLVVITSVVAAIGLGG
jgi:uncharacterized membrane protein